MNNFTLLFKASKMVKNLIINQK